MEGFFVTAKDHPRTQARVTRNTHISNAAAAKIPRSGFRNLIKENRNMKKSITNKGPNKVIKHPTVADKCGALPLRIRRRVLKP